MHRFIISAVSAALCAVSVAATNEAHFVQCVDESITNLHYAPYGVWCHVRVGDDGVAALDPSVVRSGLSRLSSAGVFPDAPSIIIGRFNAEQFGDYGIAWASALERDYPLIAGYAKSCIGRGDKVINGGGFWREFMTSDRMGVAIGELLASGAAREGSIRTYSETVMHVCSRQVKLHLRATGRSFVTRGGVNPLEEYAKRLEVCLNAPRMTGLEEFVTEIGLSTSYAIPQRFFMTDAEVKDVCEKILVDDMKLTRGNLSCRLRCAMGTDAYNAFVKEYNEGSK